MKDQTPETTAMALFTGANHMLKAAEPLLALSRAEILLPTYYLLGHSMELALKSVLLANGKSPKQLKTKFRHDLSKAARSVVALKLPPVSDLVREYLPKINVLNRYYVAKEFEYHTTGAKSLPPRECLARFLKALLPQVKRHAIKVYPSRQ